MFPYPPPARPNYALRRAIVVVTVVLALFLLYSVGSGLLDSDDDGEELGTQVEDGDDSPEGAEIRQPQTCDYTADPVQTIYVRPEEWYRTLLDPMVALPELYAPPDLVPASEAGYSAEFQVRLLIVDDLSALRMGMVNAGVPEVAILAAYRSVAEQKVLFDLRVQELGYDEAAIGTARPGHSEHHLGTTVDFRPIDATDVDASFADTESGKWLAENSWRYGFVLSYPDGATPLTCYKFEPWHFRYVGVDLATRIHNSGIPLRQYLHHWEVTGVEPGMSPAAVTTIPGSTVPAPNPDGSSDDEGDAG